MPRDTFPPDAIDENLRRRRLESTSSPIDCDLQIADNVERQPGWSDPEARRLVDSTKPLDDVIDVENHVRGPVVLVRIAGLKLHSPDVAIVPRQLFEVRLRDRITHRKIQRCA